MSESRALRALEKENDKLQAENRDFVKAVETCNHIIEDYKIEVKAGKNLWVEAQTRRKFLALEIDELRAENKELKGQISVERMTSNQLLRELKVKIADTQKFAAYIEKLKLSILSLESQLKEQINWKDEARVENDKLKEVLQEISNTEDFRKRAGSGYDAKIDILAKKTMKGQWYEYKHKNALGDTN